MIEFEILATLLTIGAENEGVLFLLLKVSSFNILQLSSLYKF